MLSATVDPGFAGDEAERLRERLRRAGLLLEEPRVSSSRRPAADQLDRARAAAAKGRPLSDLVSEGRR